MTFFILFVCIIAILFLIINLILAPHNPYQEKSSAFECGFHSFLQTRLPFNITFYIYGLLFLLFDLEIFLIFPYAISSYNNEVYGLLIVIVFLLLVTLGFIFELGKGALNIYSKQSKLTIQEAFLKISYLEK
jgi:NADH-ubiquinone oxidoreductase chain 3